MARGARPWKERMNQGSGHNSWNDEPEEKEQKTLDEWEKDLNENGR